MLFQFVPIYTVFIVLLRRLIGFLIRSTRRSTERRNLIYQVLITHEYVTNMSAYLNYVSNGRGDYT
jgi:hypothetical protein